MNYRKKLVGMCIVASCLLTSFSTKDSLLLGRWKNVTLDGRFEVELMKSGGMSIYKGDSLYMVDGEIQYTSNLINYVVDFTKAPAWFDIIYIDSVGTELKRWKGLIEIKNDTTLITYGFKYKNGDIYSPYNRPKQIEYERAHYFIKVD